MAENLFERLRKRREEREKAEQKEALAREEYMTSIPSDWAAKFTRSELESEYPKGPTLKTEQPPLDIDIGAIESQQFAPPPTRPIPFPTSEPAVPLPEAMPVATSPIPPVGETTTMAPRQRPEPTLEEKTRRAQIANAIFGGIAGLGDIGAFGAPLGKGPKPLYGRSQALYERLGEKIGRPLAEQKAMLAQATKTKTTDWEKLERQNFIKDWKWDGKTDVGSSQANQNRAVIGQMDNVINTTKKLTKLIRKHGNFESALTAEGKKIAKLTKDLQLQLKGKAVYDLGVLNGADYSIIKDVKGNPNSIWAGLEQVVGTVIGSKEMVGKNEADALDYMASHWANSLANRMGYMGQTPNNWQYKHLINSDISSDPVSQQESAPVPTSGLTPEERRAEIEKLKSEKLKAQAGGK